jgi:hypothetical protein
MGSLYGRPLSDFFWQFDRNTRSAVSSIQVVKSKVKAKAKEWHELNRFFRSVNDLETEAYN